MIDTSKITSSKKPLPGSDAAILAVFAQCSYHSLDILSLLEDLSCEEAKELGRKIIDRDRKDDESRQWLEWADGLSK